MNPDPVIPPAPPGDVEANLRAAFRLLAGERGDGAERIAAGVRRMLRGDRRGEVLRALAGAWDDPDPLVRDPARRFSCEDLVGENAQDRIPLSDPCAAPRFRMVRDQLHRQGISDPRVLRTMLEIPREIFVAESLRAGAYEPRPLAIEEGQTISQPFIVAFMTQALGLRGRERVLEIGTGSGYQAAVLARTAGEVWSIETREALSRRAGGRLERLGCGNVRLRVGDGHAGWPEAAPFDAVMVTCAPAEIPSALTGQLRPDGGRLVAPVGVDPERQDLVRLTRTPAGLREERLLAVRFVPMTRG